MNRYIVRELMPKSALGCASYPAFMSTWIQSSSELCIFTEDQKLRFSTQLLQGGGWYLECSSFIPDEEKEFYTNVLHSAPHHILDNDVVEGIQEGMESLLVATSQDETSNKKKRLTKAEKKLLELEEHEKAKVAKQAEIELAVAQALAEKANEDVSVFPAPTRLTLNEDLEWDSSPVLQSSQAAGSSLVEATRIEMQHRKHRQFQQSESSIAPATFSQSLIQNACLYSVMQSLSQPGGSPQPWTLLHDFVLKVR